MVHNLIVTRQSVDSNWPIGLVRNRDTSDVLYDPVYYAL